MTITATALLLALVVAVLVAVLLWLDRHEIARGLRHTAEELERVRAERDQAKAWATTYCSQRDELLDLLDAVHSRLAHEWPTDPGETA